MKVLNLYSGLGGNRKLWTGVSVTAIENNRQIAEVYKGLFRADTVLIDDAHQYLLDHAREFDFVWSSPPCQSHSRMMKATRHDVRKYPDMTLYQEIIYLQHFFKGRWVVENVKPYYTPLIKPTATFGRHLIWANFDITHKEVASYPNLINSTTVAAAEQLKEHYGIKYEGNLYTDGNHHPTQALRNCVPPELGLHIFNESKRYGFFNE